MELAKSATKITKTGTILIKKQKSGSATILQKTETFLNVNRKYVTGPLINYTGLFI